MFTGKYRALYFSVKNREVPLLKKEKPVNLTDWHYLVKAIIFLSLSTDGDVIST
jgi:hypothetical protein